jgi:hypothetical protein
MSAMPYAALAAALIALLAPSWSIAACVIVDGQKHGDCRGVHVRADDRDGGEDLAVTGMRSKSGVRGRIVVEEGSSLRFSGIAESIVVEPGASLESSGKAGRIVVRRRAEARITGTVDVMRNEGGEVEIEGVIGRLEARGGRTIVGGIVNEVSGSGRVRYREGALVEGAPARN